MTLTGISEVLPIDVVESALEHDESVRGFSRRHSRHHRSMLKFITKISCIMNLHVFFVCHVLWVMKQGVLKSMIRYRMSCRMSWSKEHHRFMLRVFRVKQMSISFFSVGYRLKHMSLCVVCHVAYHEARNVHAADSDGQEKSKRR